MSIAPRGVLTADVATSGAVSRVDLYLGSGAPSAPLPQTYVLSESSPGTWTGSGTAPSVAGQYHFTVGTYNAAGKRSIVDADAWNITVVGAAVNPAVAPPFPSDIPLAPGFNYGNPFPATFTADGRSINGGEVVSTTRTDIASSVVAQFYNDRFPRAGWILQSGAPAAGAPAFTVVAKSGAHRVCVVQYGASTIHIFYGDLPG